MRAAEHAVIRALSAALRKKRRLSERHQIPSALLLAAHNLRVKLKQFRILIV